MNTLPRSNLPLLVILGLVVLGTLVLAFSLASLRAESGGPAYSAPALFNQGNAAFQQGKTGEAIVNFERAHLLAPTDPDIAANLDYVRNHAGLTARPATLLDRAAFWASPNTMALLGWLGLVTTGTGILSARSFPRRRIVCQTTAFIGIIFLSLSMMSAAATWQKCHEAIAIASEASARISPVTDGEPSFKLHAGEMVSISGHYHDFVLVQNSAGHSGWVAQNDITSLIPQ